MKSLDKIKHGDKVVSYLVVTSKPFCSIDEIKRHSGLDDKTLRQVMNQLLKHGYIEKNEYGWVISERGHTT